MRRGAALGLDLLTRVVGTSLDKGAELDALEKIEETKREGLVRRAAIGELVSARREAARVRPDHREGALAPKTAKMLNKSYGIVVEDLDWDLSVRSAAESLDQDCHASAGNDARIAQTIVSRTADQFALAAADSVCFAWATIEYLAVAAEVLRLRGFRYASHYVWETNDNTISAWSRHCHEILLVGRKGNILPPRHGTQRESLHRAPRITKSDKPDWFYDMIETHYPGLPKLILNPRHPRAGWDVWSEDTPIEIRSQVTETNKSAVAVQDSITVPAREVHPRPAAAGNVAEVPGTIDRKASLLELQTSCPATPTGGDTPVVARAPNSNGMGHAEKAVASKAPADAPLAVRPAKSKPISVNEDLKIPDFLRRGHPNCIVK